MGEKRGSAFEEEIRFRYQRCRFWKCKTLRYERAVPGGQHDRGGIEDEALACRDRPAAVSALLDRVDPLAEVNRHIEGPALLQQSLDQFACRARGNGGDIVDGLVGIQLDTLASDPFERIYQQFRYCLRYTSLL